MKQECSRCSDDIVKPIVKNSNYVRSNDFAVDEEIVKCNGWILSDSLVDRRDNLKEELDKTTAQINGYLEVIARQFSIDDELEEVTQVVFGEEIAVNRDEFNVNIYESPGDARREDECVHTNEKRVTETIVKTGVICPDCYKEDDELIWGVAEQ